MEYRIAIVGSGAVGSALASTFTKAGHDVRVGSRPGSDRAATLAGKGIATGPVREVASWAEVVFLAVPAGTAVEAARSAGDLSEKVLVDCTNPVVWNSGPVLVPPPEGSVSAALAVAIPGVRVVKAFNTFGAEIHADPSLEGRPAEVLMASDEGGALEIVGEVAARAGFAPLTAGGLREAALLEALAVLWISLATVGGQGREFAFRLARR
jgi:hypothetical protein